MDYLLIFFKSRSTELQPTLILFLFFRKTIPSMNLTISLLHFLLMHRTAKYTKVFMLLVFPNYCYKTWHLLFCYTIYTHCYFIYKGKHFINSYIAFIQPKYAFNMIHNNLRSLDNRLSQVLSLRSVEKLES